MTDGKTQQEFFAPNLTTNEWVDLSIRTMQTYAPKDGKPYYGCFSGGKDSVVIKELARLASVPVEWHYACTTIDPPELTRFIRRSHPDVHWQRQPKCFFTRMVEKGFPTRRGRWCCEEFKECNAPAESISVVGVRAAESPRRKKAWQTFTFHTRQRKWVLSPILLWPDAAVWDFIRSRNIPYCSLYDEGFERLGCINCPVANAKKRERERERWPGFARQWRKAFDAIWERRRGTQQADGREWFGSARFPNCEALWQWYISDEAMPAREDECQGVLELFS